jgi:hypothetical protein
MWLSNEFVTAQPGVSRPAQSVHDAWASVPGMAAFIGKEYGAGLKSDFYDLKNEVDTVVNTYNALKNTESTRAAAYLLDPDHLRLFGMQSAVTQIGAHVSKIRAAINQITFLPDEYMSPEDKRRTIASLRETERQMLKAIPIMELRGLAGM